MTLLADLRRGFDRVRRHGLEVILRFASNDPAAGEDHERARDPPWSRVLRHIEPVRPLLGRNSDLIPVRQAGSLGAWGDWPSSSNGLDRPGPRRRIRDALLAARPADLPIPFRCPPDLRNRYPRPEEAVAQRVGRHNDRFLGDDTDVGTVWDGLDDPLRAFVRRIGRGAGFGGETREAGEPAEARFSCAALRQEARRYGLVYLNRGDAPGFIAVIERDRPAEATRSIGARLGLVRLQLPDSAAPGAGITVRLEPVKDGWAPAFHPRPVGLVLRRTGRPPVALPTSPEPAPAAPRRSRRPPGCRPTSPGIATRSGCAFPTARPGSLPIAARRRGPAMPIDRHPGNAGTRRRRRGVPVPC